MGTLSRTPGAVSSRTDTRSYGDRKKLYEGGAEVIRAEWLESNWKEKFAEFSKRPAKKLPKWFGVRPDKKAGDPETPEGEEEAAAEEEAEEEYEEEEEEEEEEEGSKALMPTCKLTQKKTRHI